MTDEEALAYYDKLVEYYGNDRLANPIHYPKIFQHQVKLYRYYNKKEVNSDEKQKTEQQIHQTNNTTATKEQQQTTRDTTAHAGADTTSSGDGKSTSD